jgi:hypothetical protein
VDSNFIDNGANLIRGHSQLPLQIQTNIYLNSATNSSHVMNSRQIQDMIQAQVNSGMVNQSQILNEISKAIAYNQAIAKQVLEMQTNPRSQGGNADFCIQKMMDKRMSNPMIPIQVERLMAVPQTKVIKGMSFSNLAFKQFTSDRKNQKADSQLDKGDRNQMDISQQDKIFSSSKSGIIPNRHSFINNKSPKF